MVSFWFAYNNIKIFIIFDLSSFNVDIAKFFLLFWAICWLIPKLLLLKGLFVWFRSAFGFCSKLLNWLIILLFWLCYFFGLNEINLYSLEKYKIFSPFISNKHMLELNFPLIPFNNLERRFSLTT